MLSHVIPQYRNDPRTLLDAIRRSQEYDRFDCGLSLVQWVRLAPCLQPFPLAQGQTLIERGAADRAVYFVESGVLSVHVDDAQGYLRIAQVHPGSVVGEGSFLSHLPRSASVVATAAARLWCLTPVRFAELARREPEIALELSLALGSVVARRLANVPRRVAVT